MKAAAISFIVAGFLLGLIAFAVMAIIDGFAFGIFGLFAGILFGVLLTVYSAVHLSIAKRKYTRYRDEHISGEIIHETFLAKLNGSKEEGYLYVTSESITIVTMKWKRVLSEIAIPLSSIASVSVTKNDYTMIVQENGEETRFIIAEYGKFANVVRPLVESPTLVLPPVRGVPKEYFKEQKRFEKLKRSDFPLVSDDELWSAATAWVYGKTKRVKPDRHLEVLSTLPMPCQYIIAVDAVDGEVNSGGFNQYYFNRSHVLTVTAAEALAVIGATRLAEIAEKANKIYSQNKGTFGNSAEDTIEEFVESYEDDPHYECDMEYYEASEVESTYDLMVAYIREHIDCFGD